MEMIFSCHVSSGVSVCFSINSRDVLWSKEQGKHVIESRMQSESNCFLWLGSGFHKQVLGWPQSVHHPDTRSHVKSHLSDPAHALSSVTYVVCPTLCHHEIVSHAMSSVHDFQAGRHYSGFEFLLRGSSRPRDQTRSPASPAWQNISLIRHSSTFVSEMCKLYSMQHLHTFFWPISSVPVVRFTGLCNSIPSVEVDFPEWLTW